MLFFLLLMILGAGQPAIGTEESLCFPEPQKKYKRDAVNQRARIEDFHGQCPEHLSEQASRVPFSATFQMGQWAKSDTVSGTFLPIALANSGAWPVVLPEQELIAEPSSEILVRLESTHSLFQRRVRFGGYYLLLAEKKFEELVGKYAHRMAVSLNLPLLHVNKEFPPLSPGGYYLLTPKQHDHVLNPDELSAVLPAAEPSPIELSMPIRPPAASPGLVRTGRGTYYHFRNDARVVVYPARQSEIHTYFLPQSHEGVASHAAILRRQGYFVNTTDAYTLLQFRLNRVAEALTPYFKTIDGRAHKLMIDANLELYRSGSKAAAWRKAMGSLARLRPSPARPVQWIPPGIDLLRGKGALSKAYSFILFRSPAKILWETQIYFFDDIHLAAAYGNLFEFALQLDRDKLLSGGAIHFTFDPESGHARSAKWVQTYSWSLARACTEALTPKEQQWVEQALEKHTLTRLFPKGS